MLKHYYIAELTTNIEISDSDFQLLWDAANTHYDVNVKELAAIGGCLFGNKNRRNFSDGKNKFLSVDNKDLQLIIKSLETCSGERYKYLFEQLSKVSDKTSELRNIINKDISRDSRNEKINEYFVPKKQERKNKPKL